MAENKPGKPELPAITALVHSGLSDLLRRAEDTAAWDQVLRRCLPEALAKHCGLVSWEYEITNTNNNRIANSLFIRFS